MSEVHDIEDDNEFEDDIAIIGMVGKFPEANDLETFWTNIRDGVESVKILTADELRQRGFGDFIEENPNFVSAEASLDNKTLETFDAAFFNMSPRETEIMDPQHRLFLESCWQLFEHAGYSTEHYDGRVGVFGSTGFSGYLESHLLPNRDLLAETGSFQIQLGNDKDFIATRVSFKMGFTGPSVSVSTLCSSAAVAVHMARESLLNFQNDFVLAGGVNISISTSDTLYYQEGGIGAGDGHCRAYDERASGTVSGSGLGIIALKRLEDAIEDGDTIDAILKGSAVNNDGSNKASYTAPSPEGQAEVIAEAIATSGVSPETINYIDGHGTATNIGDPIEITALTKAYRQHTDKKGFCGIGSVKTNIGHLVTAGGVASLIKTVLALKHQQMPPSLNFEKPNPKIDFKNSPFYVNAKLKNWEATEYPRRAAVSSFGIGGTNVHLILEEAPEAAANDDDGEAKIIVLSAKSKSALAQMKLNLSNHIEQKPELSLDDVSHTLKIGRCSFEHKFSAVCDNLTELSGILKDEVKDCSFYRKQKSIDRSICFMFSGQGSQYINMAQSLYKSDPLFSEPMDRCFEYLNNQCSIDLKSIIYPADNNDELIKQTQYTQLSLFVIEYSLAQFYIAKGVKPESMIGHSIGEYVAACLAGVFSLEDGLAIVNRRGLLMSQQPTGDMISVALNNEQLAPYLSDTVHLAANNADLAKVLSGSAEAISEVINQLTKDGIGFTQLKTSHAFHSAMMDGALEEFSSFLSGVQFNQPKIPFMSNLTGDWITGEQATSPDYWVRHLRSTVDFVGGIKTLMEDESRVFLEVGPGIALTTLAQMTLDDRQLAINSLPKFDLASSDKYCIQQSLAKLWCTGVKLDWALISNNKKSRRIPLPTYPFERKRFWIEPNNHWSIATKADLELSDGLELEQKCPQDIKFTSGKLEIDLDWKGKPSEEQRQQLKAIMELRSQLESICNDLSASAQINMKVSPLKLNKADDNQDGSFDDTNLVEANNERPDIETPLVRPQTDLQKRLASDWERALGFTPVGINDNFFELGGHSLIAAALVNQLRQEYEVEVELRELLEGPTIARVCDLIETKRWIATQTSDEVINDDDDSETLLL